MYQYFAKKYVWSINLMLPFPSAFVQAVRTYLEWSLLGSSYMHSSLNSILNMKDNLLLQLSGRFPDIPQYGMQHSKIQLLQAITK